VQTTGSRPRVYVTADGRGVVGHAGTRLLANIADVTGLTSGFSDALRVVGRRAGGHDPGRVATDVAVMLADGGEAITDVEVLRGVPELFGAVASDATVWRVLGAIDDAGLTRLRGARAAARELAWAQLVDTAVGYRPRWRADVRRRVWSSTSMPPLWSPLPPRTPGLRVCPASTTARPSNGCEGRLQYAQPVLR
jgi:hypothetical protein